MTLIHKRIKGLSPDINLARPHSTRLCRCCGIALTGPAHHPLCRPGWHWQQPAKATAQAARFFRGEARP